MHVFIVPHPDDEVLGFGGTIARLVREGNTVMVITVFARDNVRGRLQTEFAKYAQKILGYEDLEQLNMHSDCPDRELITNLEAQLMHILSETGHIAGVWTTGPSDNHQDHHKVFRAVCVALRPAFTNKISAFYTGEVISSADQAVGSVRCQFMPNTYVPLTVGDLETKIRAMKVYTGEVSLLRSEDHIRTYAKKRGNEVNHVYAEVFMLQRSIEQLTFNSGV